MDGPGCVSGSQAGGHPWDLAALGDDWQPHLTSQLAARTEPLRVDGLLDPQVVGHGLYAELAGRTTDDRYMSLLSVPF